MCFCFSNNNDNNKNTVEACSNQANLPYRKTAFIVKVHRPQGTRPVGLTGASFTNISS